jgi:hypothetical protein
MARLFVTDIDLNKNELRNARIQNISSAPSSPVTGQIYYNGNNNIMYYYNGLSAPDGPWVPMGASTEVIQDVIGISVVGGTGLSTAYSDTTGLTTVTLNNTTVTAGSYGSTTQIPTFTVDAQGRLTAAGSVSVATTLTVGADNVESYGVNLLTDQFKVVGGEGIDAIVTDDAATTTITISGEDASTTNKGIASFNSTDFSVTNGNVTLNKDPVITLSGDVAGTATMTNLGDVTITTTVQANSVELGVDTTGNYIATIAGTANEITVTGSGSETAAVTIGLPDDVSITNNLTVGGDLNVVGSINTVNVTQVNITDNKINLNSDMPEENAPSADAGIIVHRGTEADAELLWNETTDRWQVGLVSGSYHDIARKYVATIGDGVNYTYQITHNLGTRKVTVQVYDAATYATVETDVTRNDNNQVTIGFNTIPTTNAYEVVIVG